MAGSNIVDGDLRIRGTLIPDTLTVPAGTVVNAGVSASAAIATTKVRHRYLASWQQPNTNATAETRTIHVVRLPGTITEVVAGSIVAATGDSTVTVDVKKNGTSVLSSAIVLNSSNTARVVEDGTVDSAQDDVVADDWIEVVVTVSAGTGTLPTGLFVQVTVEEDGI